MSATRKDSALARNIVQLRRQRGWSQDRLADEAGVSRLTITNIERGAGVRLGTLSRIAAALGTHAGLLIGVDGSPGRGVA